MVKASTCVDEKMSWWFVLAFQLLLCATAAGAESFFLDKYKQMSNFIATQSISWADRLWEPRQSEMGMRKFGFWKKKGKKAVKARDEHQELWWWKAR